MSERISSVGYPNENKNSENIIKIILLIVFVVLVCVIIYFICTPTRRPEQTPSCMSRPYFPRRTQITIPLNAIGGSSPSNDNKEQTGSETPSQEQGGENKEGFIHRRLNSVMYSENNRPEAHEDQMVDYSQVGQTLSQLNDDSNDKLFCDFNKDNMKSATDDKSYYMDKINSSRWKRGVCRQQANKQKDYNGQVSIEGVSTGNNRVNFNGISSLGTVKGDISFCEEPCEAAKQLQRLPPSKKGTEMFKHLNEATIDDRGYANPEMKEGFTTSASMITNKRLSGGQMDLSALTGTTWKKYNMNNPNNPFPPRLNIAEGHAQPLDYVSNPNW